MFELVAKLMASSELSNPNNLYIGSYATGLEPLPGLAGASGALALAVRLGLNVRLMHLVFKFETRLVLSVPTPRAYRRLFWPTNRP